MSSSPPPAAAAPLPAGGVLPSYDEELAAAQRESVRFTAFIASPLLLVFTVLDAFIVPGAWGHLLTLRIAASLVLLALGLATPHIGARTTMSLGVIVACVMVPIEVGVLYSGGPQSSYVYAALLPMAGAPMLVPLRPAQSAFVCGEVLFLVFGPLAWAFGPDLAPSIPAASFLLCMAVIAVASAFVHDALRRKEYRTRFEMVRQAGLANLGMLAAGLAHELASPLAAASLEVERVALKGGADAVRVEALGRSLQHMRAVVNAMRAGARLSDGARRPASIADELQNALTLVQPQLPARLELVKELSPVAPVIVQPTLVSQVFVNLLVNAGHALEKRPGARVTVRLFERAGQVVVEVEDTGPGVPPELREKIFEPMFTTKGERGNGLGLWISAEIARAHDGTLTVDAAPAGGALFRLALPARRAA